MAVFIGSVKSKNLSIKKIHFFCSDNKDGTNSLVIYNYNGKEEYASFGISLCNRDIYVPKKQSIVGYKAHKGLEKTLHNYIFKNIK